MSAINALDEQNCIGLVVSNTQDFLKYQEQIARIHVRVQPLDFDSYRLLNFPKRSFKMETRWKMYM
jgi:hypothetical protein